LPKEWTDDKVRCAKVGVPKPVRFATKHDISLKQLREALAARVSPGVVLADSSYGNKTRYREALSEMGLNYCMAVQKDTTVWPHGQGPLPPRRRKKWSLGGRRPLYMQRNRKHRPTYGVLPAAVLDLGCAERYGVSMTDRHSRSHLARLD
jgi:SRSO17 transposase